MSDAGPIRPEHLRATVAVHHPALYLVLGVATATKPLLGTAGFEPAALAVKQLCL